MPLGVTARRRQLLTSFPTSYLVTISRPSIGPDNVTKSSADGVSHSRHLSGTQFTESENHGTWYRTKKSGKFSGDHGGPFYSSRQYCRTSFTSTNIEVLKYDSPGSRGFKYAKYSGPILPTAEFLVRNPFPILGSSSDSQMDALGTTAIARCKPASSHASLAESLFELKREGLPKLVGATLWKARTDKARRRAVGGEHLNVEFGYKPLANDIADSAIVVWNADALIKQYHRDAGKKVRRTYSFPSIVQSSSYVFDSSASAHIMGSAGVLADFAQLNKGKVILTETSETRVWFSGSFTYHMAIDPFTMAAMSDRQGPLRKLLGLELTPETIWNLAPWSWAVDWVSNTGDVISNLQSWSRDGMVLHYGYIMEHKISTATWTFIGPTGWLGGGRPPQVTFVTEVKKRRKATPFGFGLKTSGFTGRQLSIIAALGLSKGK